MRIGLGVVRLFISLSSHEHQSHRVQRQWTNHFAFHTCVNIMRLHLFFASTMSARVAQTEFYGEFLCNGIVVNFSMIFLLAFALSGVCLCRCWKCRLLTNWNVTVQQWAHSAAVNLYIFSVNVYNFDKAFNKLFHHPAGTWSTNPTIWFEIEW